MAGVALRSSDFIVDGLQAWWEHSPTAARERCSLLQIKVDNGPESNGQRTQFLYRMVQFADAIGKPIQLLYFPPYHSKYNPIERCWGILEQHWNGAQLLDADTMLEWAKTMTWKGLTPSCTFHARSTPRGSPSPTRPGAKSKRGCCATPICRSGIS